jgi:DNA-directed RNA polymerase III subunit RPC5
MAARIKVEILAKGNEIDSSPDAIPSGVVLPQSGLESMEIDDDEMVNGDNNDDNDDPIVREIDVYLSPEMVKQLYLLQYPLQHEEIAPTMAARMKPRHGLLEIDHPLPNAIERDGRFDISQRTYQSQTIPVTTHMCLGKMKTDENNNSSLHLVPLNHIIQMRPNFKHVDDAYEDPRARDRKLEEEEAKAAEKKPLAFKRKESERAQNARLSSYSYKKQSEETEEWFDLKVQEYQSMPWHTFMKSMVCPNPAQFVLKQSCDDTSYIRSLNYLSNNTSTNMSDTQQKSRTDAITVTMKLVSLLHLGCLIPFRLIRDKFGSHVDDNTLLNALDACSIIVRGNYCLQSKYLNITDMLKPVRTFILLLLVENGFVNRTRVSSVFQHNHQFTPEKLFAILDMVAKKNPNRSNDEDKRGWIPKIEDDDEFISANSDRHQRHMEYWAKQKERFQKQLNLYSKEQVE